MYQYKEEKRLLELSCFSLFFLWITLIIDLNLRKNLTVKFECFCYYILIIKNNI